jgi:hypothetical protein
MRVPPIDQKTARDGHINVVIAQQLKLIEQQQQARGIPAGVDAVELPGIKHVLGAGPHHMVCCAGNRTNAPIEPGVPLQLPCALPLAMICVPPEFVRASRGLWPSEPAQSGTCTRSHDK